MNGALPPSSSDTFFTWPAHCAINSLPTSVEPVKPSLRTIGLDVISPPIAGASAASPVTTEKTPAGTPASSASAAIASAESGVCSAGFSTIVQPTASAGADLRVGIAAGKFHGVMPAVTPIASRSTTIRRSGERLRDHAPVEPLGLLAEPLVERGGVGDLGLGLEERLALLAHEQRGEVVGALEHQVGEAAQDARPVLGCPVLPGGERPLGGFDRPSRLGCAHPRHLGDRRAGRRVDDRERRAGVGVDPGAVDIGLVAEEVGLEGSHRRDDSDSGSRRPGRIAVRRMHFRAPTMRY